MNPSSSILKSVTSPQIFLRNKTIFLIDGSNDVYGLSSYLNSYEANSYIATNCLETFTKLEQIPVVDLVVIDVNCKGINAFETIRTIKNRKPWRSIPILAVSASYDLKDREKYLSIGAIDYVYKSDELDFLFLKINHILNSPPEWNKKEVTTVLELFVNDASTLKSVTTIKSVKNWLENNCKSKWDLKIIDVTQDKRWALRRKIVVTPMLLSVTPNQHRVMVSDLHNIDRIFKKLGVLK